MHKLSHKQDTILKIVDFSTKNYDFPPKPLLQILPCKNPSARVLGENLYLRQRFTVFKVEYFLYIIQVMLQYTPSFNKVCISKQKYQNQYIASPTEKKYNPNFSFFLKEIKELPSA
jgi:hypothetical protein